MFAKEFKVTNISPVNWLWEQNEYSFLTNPRSSYGFLTIEKGKVDYIIGDKTITLEKGDFIYLPKNSVYKARFHINEGEVKTLLVNFDLEEGSNISIPEFYHGTDEHLQFESAIKRLCDLELDEDAIYLKQAYFYLCYHIMYNSCINDKHPVDTKLIIRCKEKLLHSELSIEEIAEELKVSSSGLRKKFKEATNKSPSEWRNEKRIERAKALLMTSDLSIDEIAREVGFYDTPYFYKKFYILVGTTPKKYRKTENIF